MDTKVIFDYLEGLQRNNNRIWYKEHKKEYQAAYEEFLKIVDALMLELGPWDSRLLEHDPRDLTFKLVRDTRFSKDKSPYNPSFRAHIGPLGKLPVPVGYYLVIRPGESFLGGGLFSDMFKDATGRIRDYIVDNREEWCAVVEDPAFREYFQVKGNALKNVPAGYDKAHPLAEYLKYKSWYVEYPVTDRQVLDSDRFMELAGDVFRRMTMFNHLLNKALDGFVMPERP